jgi:hypothetical protein
MVETPAALDIQESDRRLVDAIFASKAIAVMVLMMLPPSLPL